MKIGEFMKKLSQHFKLEGLTCKDLLPIYKRLKALEYTESNIFKRLGVADIEFIQFQYLPIYLLVKMKENTALDSLIKLFMLSQWIGEAEINRLFDRSVLKTAMDVGLLGRDEEGFFAHADLFPCCGKFFATDHRFTSIFLPRHVYPLGLDSYMLARGMIREPAKYTLDLCTGSGVQAILASEFSERVVGVDLNPRSVNFGRFNALLNQVENVRFLRGNLYNPVKDEKFDRIFANPPFVPSPKQSLYFRDGKQSGEAILEKIIAGIPKHLEDNSYAQVVSLLVFKKDEKYVDKIRQWLGSIPMHILAVANRYKEVEPYILSHIEMNVDFDKYSRDLINWIETYKQNKIIKLADGLINIKKVPGVSFRGELKEFHVMRRPFSKEVKTYLDMSERLDDEGYLNEILKMNFELSGNIDFYWEGFDLEGNRNYGVLFKKNSFFVDEKIDRSSKEILDIIASGANKGEEIAKNFESKLDDSTDALADTKEKSGGTFYKCMINMLKYGIIKVAPK